MSKVEAYICDKCQQIKENDEIIGFNRIEDLFDKIESYNIVGFSSNRTVDDHFCLDCYYKYCTLPAQNHVNRKDNEAGFQRFLKELTYTLKNSILYTKRQAEVKTKHRKK